jgi:2-C-methyl-D-erythritol 4-phosphate cytidylyltransferase
MSQSTHNALLLCAGSGERMRGCVPDKILAPLGGRPVFCHALAAFLRSGCIGTLALIYRDRAQRGAMEDALATELTTLSPEAREGVDLLWVAGGPTRQESVIRGLDALPATAQLCFIHDAARPLITPGQIRSLAEAASAHGSACRARPVTDTIKRADPPGAWQQATLQDLPRDGLRAMETPQVFQHRDIVRAYQHVRDHHIKVTDDAAAASSIDMPVTLIHLDDPNPKITTPADLDYLGWLLSR